MIEQHRIALRNVGRIDPASIQDYMDRGGYDALKKALQTPSDQVVHDITQSGLRGRGGAGFSTGLKKKYTSQASCVLLECMRYIVCNADEGEPGTFKDRIIMEGDPHLLVEGMVIAAYAVGAERGYIYIRGEYHQSITMIRSALVQARRHGFLGNNILGSGFSLDIEVKLGAGSYLCGEELTLLESLEGRRGYPRVKPPFPAESGLFGKPTLINNVETLSHIPAIVINGARWYRQLGTETSPGTKIFTISGEVNHPGYAEVEMGIPLRELIDRGAGGMKDGKRFKAALLGGAAGTFVPESLLDVCMDFDALKEKDAVLGSGAVIVMSTDQSILTMLDSILRFFEHESCGKCVPCRVGTRQLVDLLKRLKGAEGKRPDHVDALVYQSELMANTSLCPLGQSPVLAIKSAVRYFRDELETPQISQSRWR
ncbi:NADH-quinone oxidoreductase subunit NuoF [Desulfosarcina sp.]|uniref:NADH-quinone oxidoreductase subunit NuoF n=1 Tax=Desulfosarcina sp. TaxID=2027861 RepID=UPI00356AD7B1